MHRDHKRTPLVARLTVCPKRYPDPWGKVTHPARNPKRWTTVESHSLIIEGRGLKPWLILKAHCGAEAPSFHGG